MTQEQKNNLAMAIVEAIDRITEEETTAPATSSKCEMWTIAEAATEVKGLSAHTIRKWVAQGKIPSVRTGVGENGKILISKAALINYVNGREV